MNKVLNISLVALSIFFGNIGETNGQTNTNELTLKQCIAKAVTNNTEVKKAAIDRQIGLSKVNEIKGSGLPQIKAVGSLDVFPSIPTQLLPGEILGQPGTFVPVQFGTKYSTTGGFEATQVIFNQQLLLGIRAASKSNELYELAQLQTEESISYQVARSFFQLQQTQLQLSTIDANMDRLSKLEKIIRSQYENDMARKVDLQRVQVNMNNLKTQQATLNSAIDNQKNFLKIWIGLDLDESLNIIFDEYTTINVLEENESLDFNNRTDFRNMVLQMEMNVLEKKNIQSGYYPTLSAYGRYNYQAQRNEFNFFDRNLPWFETTVIGLQLSIPVFDGFQKHQRVVQNKLTQTKFELDMENMQKNAKLEALNTRNQLTNNLLSIEDQKANIALADEVYQQTDMLYRESLASLSEVLDSESSMREAKINFNNEVLNYQLNYLDYLKQKGQLKTLSK